MRLIIIIDDCSELRTVIGDIASLIDPSLVVKEAGNGREGLALVLEETPNLVFLDFQMPVMDGYDVAFELAKAPNRDQFRLVGMSGMPQLDERGEAMRALCDHWLVKPLNYKAVADFF